VSYAEGEEYDKCRIAVGVEGWHIFLNSSFCVWASIAIRVSRESAKPLNKYEKIKCFAVVAGLRPFGGDGLPNSL